MKKEVREQKAVTRDRIKELKAKDVDLQKDNERIMQQGQMLNQKIAQNNTERLKIIGAIEELEKQIA